MKKKRFLIGCDVVWNVKIRDRLQRFLSLLLDDMCQLSTKHGYVNELPIKTVL